MIVVSDTSPLTALLTVGEADLLPELFHEVIISEAVLAELKRSRPLHLAEDVRTAALMAVGE